MKRVSIADSNENRNSLGNSLKIHIKNWKLINSSEIQPILKKQVYINNLSRFCM